MRSISARGRQRHVPSCRRQRPVTVRINSPPHHPVEQVVDVIDAFCVRSTGFSRNGASLPVEWREFTSSIPPKSQFRVNSAPCTVQGGESCTIQGAVRSENAKTPAFSKRNRKNPKASGPAYNKSNASVQYGAVHRSGRCTGQAYTVKGTIGIEECDSGPAMAAIVRGRRRLRSCRMPT